MSDNEPDDSIAALSATELLRLYRRRRLSPVEVTEAALARIDRHNATVNAFCLVDRDAALAAARAAEERWLRGRPCGLVDGVPCTIKDVLLTRGWPTLRGSRTVNPKQSWDEDAPATARLREHGAVLLGKTTTPEFGWKAVTDSPLTGITRNPWNLSCTPGGSSGGAAVAAALGMGTLHLGTDGGGSIRIPAGFTGVVGFKPSFGRVPAYPLSPFGTLAHVGPLTRSVSDSALLLNVLAEPDARDWFSLPPDWRDYRVGLEDGVRGLRVAFSPTLGYVQVDPEIRAAVTAVARLLADLGAQVEETDPGFSDPLAVFNTLWYSGAAQALAHLSEAERAAIDPGLRDIAHTGAACRHHDYLQAVQARSRLGLHLRLFHERYDLLLTPTLPIPAFAAGQELADPATQTRWPEWTRFSYPFNLTQQPAISLPGGFTRRGLPIGVQLVGANYQDALVLRAARTLEAVQPTRFPLTPLAGA